MNIQLLLTGNELMSGDVIDSNSAMIAQSLKDHGIEVSRKVTVSDDLQPLVNELIQMSQSADVLIVNGGLGPTVDDLTAQALAQAANSPLVYHDQALAHLATWCAKRGFQLNEANKKQAYLPQACDIIANPIGSAVGFKLDLNQCQIYCTPGVPVELKAMLNQQILPELIKQQPVLVHMHVTRWQVFGIGESTLQQMIGEQFPDWPDSIELGFRASMPLLELKLTSRSQVAFVEKQAWQQKLKAMLGEHIIGENNCSMAKTVVQLLAEQHKHFSVAESCTGGLIASQITSVAGSSKVFEAGIVSYSNQMKNKLLNVDQQLLAAHGAVSEQTAIAMLKGSLAISGADLALAVTGIAGPDGGSTQKPVGMVWLAWGNAEFIQTCCLYLPGQRYYFQHYVAAIGLDLIRRILINSQTAPLYLSQREFTPTNLEPAP
jgi:nicotinamide-nucleotide amidase